MTNEELYNTLNERLKEQGTNFNQLEIKILSEQGKKPNFKVTKTRLSLPHTISYPYLTAFLNDDEMHEITIKKIDSIGDDGEAYDLLDDILAKLEPSQEYLYKLRLKRKMQREVL